MTIDVDRLSEELVAGQEMRKYFSSSDIVFFSFRNGHFVVKPKEMSTEIEQAMDKVRDIDSNNGVYEFPGGFINWVRNSVNGVSGIAGRV